MSEEASSGVDDGRTTWSMAEKARRGIAIGFNSRRGNAEVKYQYHGLVPQAEAPRPLSAGKTLARKADNSGQIGTLDCQKKVSIETVKARPTSAPNSPAGMIVRVRRVHLASFVAACVRKYKQ